ncbi:MAG TPA: biotin--[acetyl-CoA-carboxylase] ligase [Vicinamibacteria bacterium]
MGSGARPRRRDDPEGDRRPEGQAFEGPEIVSPGTRLRSAGSSWGSFILIVDETDSTNVLATSLARRGAPHGSIVLAKVQSAGRGRWGRKWESGEGGLYLSILIRPEASGDANDDRSRDLGVLPLTASVAAAEAIRESAAVASELRWPNDLFFAGRKLGGILCETSFVGRKCDFAVVGIGVNVNQPAEEFPEAVASRATSLRAILGREVDPLDLGLAVVVALEKWWEREGRPRILERWRELAGDFEGARVLVVPREGGSYRASIVGLANDGGLEVRLEDGGLRILHSDEVHLQEDTERESDEDFYREVESYFVARRGSPLFITPSEWDLVWRWEQLGIPLAVVKEGIDRVFDRPKTLLKPRRLGYCRQTVEAAFRRFRDSGLGARAGATTEEGSGAAAHLNEIASRLRTLAAEWSNQGGELALSLERAADAVRSLSERAPEAPVEVERELEALDGNLVAASEAVLGEAAREELRREAASSLESYRERMPEKIYRAALESAYRRRLRKKLGLPTVSLYGA